MGLASAQVELRCDAPLAAGLTELIIDTLQEKMHLREVLLPLSGLSGITAEPKPLAPNEMYFFFLFFSPLIQGNIYTTNLPRDEALI